MNELKTLTKTMLPALEAEMRDVLNGEPDDPFMGMLHYHMGWMDAQFAPIEGKAGKRIRPLLALLTCQAAGGNWQDALPAGAAIELLHNFSLIHDDIEDGSPTRRGRDTIWKIWGLEQGINIGDTLFALSHLALGRLIERGVSAQITVASLRRFSETCVALTKGQYLDMSFEQRDVVTVADYLEMITGKTAVLLALCCELGAKIAGQDDETQQHLAQFGLNCGLAFQVIDDILGIWGDEAHIGKSASTDIMTKKKTLPVLFGLENSDGLRDLYARTAVPDRDFVTEAIAQLDQADAHTYATEIAAQYTNNAVEHLEAAQLNGAAALALRQLTDSLLQRDY